MILGLSLQAFTALHVAISLIAIASGLVVLGGALKSQRLPGWTALFLTTTVLTSVTGFLFPVTGVTPALIVGAVSLLVLVAAIVALYVFDLSRAWRSIYVAAAVLALYLNVLVLVVQAFQKIDFLNRFAPTGSEPAFIGTQTVVLIIFIWLGYLAIRKFHPGATARI